MLQQVSRGLWDWVSLCTVKPSEDSTSCLGYNEISAFLVDVGTLTVLIPCECWEVFSLCVVSWSLSSFLPCIMCISSGVYPSTGPRQTSHLRFSALEFYQLCLPKLWSHLLHSGSTRLTLASLFCFVEWKVPLVWAWDTLQVPLLVSFLMGVTVLNYCSLCETVISDILSAFLVVDAIRAIPKPVNLLCTEVKNLPFILSWIHSILALSPSSIWNWFSKLYLTRQYLKHSHVLLNGDGVVWELCHETVCPMILLECSYSHMFIMDMASVYYQETWWAESMWSHCIVFYRT